jgi:outer membrane receptor protein involved in Fe transport
MGLGGIHMFGCPRHLPGRVSGAYAWIALLFVGVASAQEHYFDIPAESAAASIPEFARQAGVQIVAPGDLAGTATAALKGRLETRDALQRLLAGTDLVIAADDGSVIALRLASRATATAPTATDACNCAGQSTTSGMQESMTTKNECMKRLLMTGGSSLLLVCGFSGGAWAQVAAPNAPATAAGVDTAGDSLEEVVVTAQRRSEDVQKVPASIVVLQGNDLREQGRISTQQILEDVANVTYAPPNEVLGGGTSGGDNPNGNIAIRGVQSTQTTAGIAGPSATATYVDDVYQGVGGDYDISRVEVLRGPQGTLYGRSATGGVVAFHTNDPQLGQWGGDAYAEYGSDDLRNVQAAINIPVGDTLAVRVAGHLDERLGFWWDVDGGYSREEEGRIKLLYAPIDNLKILLSASTEYLASNSGGHAPILSAPTTIDYTNGSNPSVPTAGEHYDQYSANINYDFGGANLTYVASMHTYSRNGFAGFYNSQSGVQASEVATPLDQFNTQELRLSSDPGSKLTWIVGASFYSQIYNFSDSQLQLIPYEGGPGIPLGTVDPNPNAPPGTFMFEQLYHGETKDYSVFTEETYPVLDNLRLTAGLRYDRTEVNNSAAYVFNQNLDMFLSSLNPPTNANFSLNNAETDYDNVTYKARAEYDLTPVDMLYAMVSTGFLPGDTQISPVVNIVNAFMGKPVTVSFKVLPYDQERLTSYEIGTKNRLLDDHLQLNAAIFYYDYQGYQEAVNVQPNSPIPEFVTVSVPVRMAGAEFDATWAPTAADRITLSGGVIDAQVSSYPDLGSGLGSTSQYIGQRRLAGIPPASADLIYAHIFLLPDGSKLVPRVEGRYADGDYVETLTASQVPDGGPFDHQSAYGIYHFGLSWTSANGMFTTTAYVRNIGNTIYKSYLNGGSNFTTETQVIPSDPRTFGISVNVKF